MNRAKNRTRAGRRRKSRWMRVKEPAHGSLFIGVPIHFLQLELRPSRDLFGALGDTEQVQRKDRTASRPSLNLA